MADVKLATVLQVAFFAACVSPCLAIHLEGIIFMGYEKCLARSNTQNQKYIRALAVDTRNIFISQHAKAQMKSRQIGINEVYDVLRHGAIVRPPVANAKKGNLECRMERYVGGRECAVVVAFDDEDPALIVVTAMEIGK